MTMRSWGGGLSRIAGRATLLPGMTLLLTAAAHGGGYDTGERSWNAIFLKEGQRILIESQGRWVNPGRRLTDVSSVLTTTTASVDETEAFFVLRASATVGIYDTLRCMGSLRQPFEGHANYGDSWAGSASAIEQHFSTRDMGLTCAWSFNTGSGSVGVLAGGSWQTAEYELTASVPGQTFRRVTSVDDGSFAWRAGLTYEFADYATRVSLIYNAQVDYDMEGTLKVNMGTSTLSQTNVAGEVSMPQSVTFDARSGVAPGVLVFATVTWTDWSVMDAMSICAAGTSNCTQAAAVSGLTLLWEDSWTVTGGAAYQFNDWLAVAGSLTWDQGASAGFTSQSDVWSGGLNVILTPHEAVSVDLGGTVGVMTSGKVDTRSLANGVTNPVGYTAEFGNDIVYSISAGVTFRF